MKKLLAIPFLLPVFLFAQQKKTGDFIKEFLYVKVSPTLIGVAEEPADLHSRSALTPAIYGAVGLKMRYAAVGFSTGYFKWKPARPTTPRGIDITITDFKQKVFPVIIAQWHKAPYEGQDYWGRSSTYISGKDMYSIAAGGSIRMFKTTKMMLTWGFTKWKCNVTRTYTPRGPTNPITSYFYSKEDYKMVFLAASLVW